MGVFHYILDDILMVRQLPIHSVVQKKKKIENFKIMQILNRCFLNFNIEWVGPFLQKGVQLYLGQIRKYFLKFNKCGKASYEEFWCIYVFFLVDNVEKSTEIGFFSLQE